MKKKSKGIPKEDLKLINDSFKNSGPAPTLIKDASGNLKKAVKAIPDTPHFVLESFRGRTLKQNKSLLPVDGPQVMIGKAGQLYDDIPLEQRKRIYWSESDFV